ncbi:MAG TPA: hypothetical protein VLB09_00495 [Nitrospiria bacterium]|nr:hypothetical protein [Nitrospiria bacterium]
MNLEMNNTTDRDSIQEEIRCRCGSLVARRVGENIELKCRRCKRLAHISLSRLSEKPGGIEVQF